MNLDLSDSMKAVRPKRDFKTNILFPRWKTHCAANLHEEVLMANLPKGCQRHRWYIRTVVGISANVAR